MKKALSFVLTVIMLISILSGLTFDSQASTNGHTQAEAVEWAKARANEHYEINDGSGWTQCVEFLWAYYEFLVGYHVSGNACDYLTDKYGACPPGWSRPNKYDVQPGDIVVWDKNAYFRADRTDYCLDAGHIGVVISVSGNSMVTAEANAGEVRGATGYKYNREVSCISGLIRPDFTDSGPAMPTGYDRTLPDGDYLICNTASTDKTVLYYLDIEGTDVPAGNGTNVSLCGPLSGEPGACEIWTITYLGGFYYIKQKGTNTSLDVWNIDMSNGANIGVSAFNGGYNQQWAISFNGINGYRIQARHSGMSVDVANGGTATGTNIQQCNNNTSQAQSWIFIPYKPAQNLPNGRYVIKSALSNSIEVDIPGDTGNVQENVNVQMWSDTALSRYNSFDITKLSNGYYKIIHAASGKSLDVTNGVSDKGSNIALHTSNNSITQQFAIVNKGYNGGYVIIPRCSGLALDVANASTANGANVMQHPFHGDKNQTWSFVNAEYTVTYNANAGKNAPSAQTKYYKADLTLSTSKPTRTYYVFTGWNTKADGTGTSYASGAVYKADANITLYAQWKYNHTHTASDWQTVIEPTCTVDGVKQKVCTVCGNIVESGSIPKKGHSWDEGIVIKEPTINEQGTRKYTCSNCKTTKTETIPSLTESYKGFPDVKEGAWYYDAVKYVALRDYMGGYSNGNFGPADNLKRQDFVLILARIAGADLSKYENKTSKFSDVKKGAYYYSAVIWAVENGIIGGYSNGKFGVGDNITREQVATILYRYIDSPTVANVDKTLSKFKDYKKISSYAKAPLAWAVQNGVISGMADGRIAPSEGASRAQIAVIIMRLDENGMFFDDWQSAFKSFILNKTFLKHGNTSLGYGELDDPLCSVTFALHDMDNDSVPELIIFNGFNGRNLRADYYFKYTNKVVKYCGSSQDGLYASKLCHGLFAEESYSGTYLGEYASKYTEVVKNYHVTISNGSITKTTVYIKGRPINSSGWVTIEMTDNNSLYNASQTQKFYLTTKLYKNLNTTSGWSDFVTNYK